MSSEVLKRFVALVQFQPDKQSVAAVDSVLDGLKGKLMAVAAVAAPAALAVAMTNQLKAATALADGYAKQARQIGVTTEVLQEYTYAAGLSGVKREELIKGIDRSSVAVREAVTGNKELAKTYRQIGLNVRDLAKLSPEKRFEAIGLALAKVTDPAKRAALQTKLLGEEGRKMASLFAGGASAIQAMRDEANEMGLVIPDATAQRAEAFNDSLDRLKMIAGALRDQFLLGLLPAIQPVLNDLTSWSKGDAKLTTERLKEIGRQVSEMIKTFHGGLKDIRAFTEAMGGTSRALTLFGVIIGSILAAKYLLNMHKGVRLLTMANLKLVASTVAAALPYLALAAVIAFVVFAIEDLYHWLEGGESVMGDVFGAPTQDMIRAMQAGLLGLLAVIGVIAIAIGSIPIMIAVLLALVAALIIYWDEVSATLSEFVDVAGAEIGNLGRSIWEGITGAFDRAMTWVEEMWDSFIARLQGKLMDILGPALAAFDSVSGLAGDVGGTIRGLFSDGSSGPAVDAAGAAARTSNGAPRQELQIGTVQIDASSALTPEELQAATSAGISDAMLREAQRGFAPRAAGA